MTKFYGIVGFGHTVDKGVGVHEDIITTRHYYGDVISNNRRQDDPGKVLPDLVTSNSISIVADDYAGENIFAIRYVEWAGALWIVSNVEVQRPRLLLRLGGVYNGPTG